MIKEKAPKVITLSGSVIIFKIGRRKIVIHVKIKPARIRVVTPPAIVKPLKIDGRKDKASVFIAVFRTKDFIKR